MFEPKATAPHLDSTRHARQSGRPPEPARPLFELRRMGWLTRTAGYGPHDFLQWLSLRICAPVESGLRKYFRFRTPQITSRTFRIPLARCADPLGQSPPRGLIRSTVAMAANGVHLRLFRSGSEVPAFEQSRILDDIEKIMSTNWSFTRRHWSEEDSPFHPEYGIVLLVQEGSHVGYSIYKRLNVDGHAVLYRAGAAVSSDRHGRGLYRMMTAAMLEAEKIEDDHTPLYLSWRTRNPVVWTFNSGLCGSVVPSPQGTGKFLELEVLCSQVAAALYPDVPLRTPLMVMPNVYEHLTENRRNYTHLDQEVVNWFADMLPDPASAILSVGRLR
jgi:hypothetical protein